MGYNTVFNGSFKLDRPLTLAHQIYLTKFSETRRMARDNRQLIQDRFGMEVGLPLGIEGEYYVRGDEAGVVDYNSPPKTQPGLWCNWVPNTQGTEIIYNNVEKFYKYKDWIYYLLENFLIPWGYIVNGTISYSGEYPGDSGDIIITDNTIYLREDYWDVDKQKIIVGTEKHLYTDK